MPPKTLFDVTGVDFNAELFDQEAIREYNPHRGQMEHLNAIVWADPEQGRIIGRKNVRGDEFWVPGHIPGRPLLPGVLMIEAGAQLASFYTKKFVGWKGFVGFGGVDQCKFRAQVIPDCTMYIFGQKMWERHHRISCDVQGWVDGNLAFEATIVGTEF